MSFTSSRTPATDETSLQNIVNICTDCDRCHLEQTRTSERGAGCYHCETEPRFGAGSANHCGLTAAGSIAGFTFKLCRLINSAQFLWIISSSFPVRARMSDRGQTSRGFKICGQVGARVEKNREGSRDRIAKPCVGNIDRLNAAAFRRAATLCAIGVTITDRVMLKLAVDARARNALSRPEPGPCTSTSGVLTP